MKPNEPSFHHLQVPRCGVLLVNLGSPDAPTPSAVRRFLAQFLSDRRVIELSPWLWRPILHGIVLRVRPRRVARNYQKIWSDEGSPLLVYSQRLAQRVGEALATQVPGPVSVAVAMTYGRPSVTQAVDRLLAEGVRRLLVVPLFPQYSATTTAAAHDAVARDLAQRRFLPELRWINHYHDEPDYIGALADSVTRHWDEHGRPKRLLMSFHGIPERYFAAGDPYSCHCNGTARLLAERLGLAAGDWELVFQSRFGREPWLRPYLDQRLGELAAAGVDDVQVICPGFAADCLETLEEIEEENRSLFLGAGGRRYGYIPALNDAPAQVELLAGLIRRHGQGWAEFAPDYDPARAAARAQASAERARAAGGAR